MCGDTVTVLALSVETLSQSLLCLWICCYSPCSVCGYTVTVLALSVDILLQSLLCGDTVTLSVETLLQSLLCLWRHCYSSFSVCGDPVTVLALSVETLLQSLLFLLETLLKSFLCLLEALLHSVCGDTVTVLALSVETLLQSLLCLHRMGSLRGSWLTAGEGWFPPTSSNAWQVSAVPCDMSLSLWPPVGWPVWLQAWMIMEGSQRTLFQMSHRSSLFKNQSTLCTEVKTNK